MDIASQAYFYWHRFIVFLYFHRARVVHGERLPTKGPILFVSLHKNGAVDGFVLHRFLPSAVFLISVQLRREWESIDQGVWRMPSNGKTREILTIAPLAPIALAATFLNAPPLLAAGGVARLKADDTNVIALWRILVGVPTFVLWAVFSVFLWNRWIGVKGCAVYLGVSFGGLAAWSTVLASAHALYNGLRFPSLQEGWDRFRESLWRVLDEIK